MTEFEAIQRDLLFLMNSVQNLAKIIKDQNQAAIEMNLLLGQLIDRIEHE